MNGWIFTETDDLTADFRHYYHVSPFELTAQEAAALAKRLPNFWEVNTDVNPPRVCSAVHARQKESNRESEESKVLDGSALAQLGIDFVEV